MVIELSQAALLVRAAPARRLSVLREPLCSMWGRLYAHFVFTWVSSFLCGGTGLESRANKQTIPSYSYEIQPKRIPKQIDRGWGDCDIGKSWKTEPTTSIPQWKELAANSCFRMLLHYLADQASVTKIFRFCGIPDSWPSQLANRQLRFWSAQCGFQHTGLIFLDPWNCLHVHGCGRYVARRWQPFERWKCESEPALTCVWHAASTPRCACQTHSPWTVVGSVTFGWLRVDGTANSPSTFPSWQPHGGPLLLLFHWDVVSGGNAGQPKTIPPCTDLNHRLQCSLLGRQSSFSELGGPSRLPAEMSGRDLHH